MEEIEKIWKDQKQFNRNFVNYEELDKQEKVEQTKEYVLHINSELDELLREMAWKVHRKQDGHIIMSNLKEEWIDIFKYWLSIGLIWGFNPQEFLDEYYRKSSVVEQRFRQEKELDFDSNKIAGIDIDGVLAPYPECFIEYVNEKIGTNFKVEDLEQYNLYEAMDIPTDIMLDLKDKFRQSGKLAEIGVFEGAKEFLEKLKGEGYRIVLLSARPYKKYRRIFADTQEWLKNHLLPYDAILYGEDKCNRLIREFGHENVEFFVEDHIKNANDIAKTTKCYLIDRPYNQGNINENVIRINNFKQIFKMEG